MNTVCKKCVFEEPNYGCKLDKLKKLEEAGAVIVKDETTGSATILGRLCGYCRNLDSEWVKQVPQEEWETKVREENTIKMLLIVQLDDPSHEEPYIANVCGLTTKPVETVFLVNEKYGAADLYSRLIAKQLDFKWSVSMCVDDSLLSPVDVILNRYKVEQANFYTMVCGGYSLPANFIKDLDYTLNEKMVPFVLVVGPGVAVFSVAVHHALGGFRDVKDENNVTYNDLINKIIHVTKLDKTEYLVKDFQELCKNL